MFKCKKSFDSEPEIMLNKDLPHSYSSKTEYGIKKDCPLNYYAFEDSAQQPLFPS